MPLQMYEGDLLQSTQPSLMLGLNMRGQASADPLESRLRDLYPVFFSEYRRLGRQGALQLGKLWFFKEATPWLIGAVVYPSHTSTLRLRHVEQVIVALYQQHELENIEGIALAPLGSSLEADGLAFLLDEYLSNYPYQIDYYRRYFPDYPPSPVSYTPEG